MAQDAELKLKVSLDLAYFRAQLSRLPIEAAGYSAPINVKINQKSIADQYRLLNKYFGKKEFRIEVNSNLESEIKNAGRLVKALQSVQKASTKTTGGLPLGTGQLGIRKPTGGLGVDEIKKLFNASIQAGLLDPKTLGKTRGQMVAALGSVGRDSIEGLLNGLDSGNTKVRSAAESLGKDLIAATKNVLGIASPSKIFDALGRFTAEGFDDGFTKKFKEFKGGAIAEIRQFIAQLRAELAKAAPMGAGGGSSSGSAWRQFLQDQAARPRGGRVYTAPIGPLPMNSQEPWAVEGGGYTPRLASSIYQRPAQLPSEGMLAPFRANPSYVDPNSFLAFSRQASQIRRRTGGVGAVPEGGFSPDGMLGGKAGPATFIGANSSMEKFKTAVDIASASTRNFRASSLPLIGGLKEISSEFLNATSQVLLYGTAYKGLAFVTSLPGQILNAAKSQQQFSNAMQTATQDTGTFAKEMLYVDNVQRAFGLNLETTRQGFVRLYASMAPTGFDSGSIEKLFTGISAATAALQLTPDKAERVIYAFGQMASKGQIMSEELKGQLGDVLPGALALFAKAAGMSVKEFSQAMENGEFVGQRFREVFAKVSDELMNRFGTGAQAAGKSLQGLLNTVQGDFRRTLESFAPLANAAAQSILGPLSGALKQLSMSAQLAMGEQDRAAKQLAAAQKDVKDLTIGGAKPEQIRAAEQNVAALQSRLELLNAAAADPAIAQQVKNIQAFVSEVGKAATAVMNITGLISNALNPVMTFLGTNLSTVITVLASFAIGLASVRIIAMTVMGALTLMNIAVKAAGAGSVSIVGLSTAFNVLGVSASSAQIGVIGLGTALKVLLVSTGIGALIALVTGLGAAFFSMGDSAKKAAEDAKAASQQIKDAALSGNVSMLQMQAGTAQANIKDLQTLQAKVLSSGRKERQFKNVTTATVSPTATQRQQAALLGVQLPQGQLSETQVQNLFSSAISGQRQVVQGVGQALPTALQRQKAMGLNQPAPMAPGIDAQEAGKDSKTKLSEYSSEAIRIKQKGIDNLIKEINATVELTKRQKELRIAEVQYTGGLEIASLQHAERIKDIGKLKEGYRGLAKAEADRMLGVEQSSLRQDYNKAVLGDLFDITENYTNQITQAEDKVAGLSESTGELTERQKLDLSIQRQLQGASEKDLPLFQSRIDKARDLADKLDILNQTEKDLLQTRKLQQELDARQKEVGVMGQGLGAGFYGSAAQVYERTLLQPGATPDYARQMAQLESQAMQLESVFGSIQNAIGGIGDAFGTMMTQGITSMIQGTATAQEVFSSFLKAVGDALLQAAAQMIATYIAIGIAKAFAGLGGGGAAKTDTVANFNAGVAAYGIAEGGYLPGGFQAFAEGGMVTGPTLGLIGEGGEPEYVIPQSKMRGAMERYAAGTRGASVIPGSADGAGGGEAMAAMMGPIDVRYQVERINSVDYVTADQFQVGLAQAARQGATQGEQRTLRRLQMSASTRRRVGI